MSAARPNSPASLARNRWLWATVLLLAFAAAGYVYFSRRDSESEQILTRAKQALERESFTDAERWAEQLLEKEPRHGQALLIAGESAAAQRRLGEAVDYYDRIPWEDSAAPLGIYAAGEILLESNRLEPAAERFRRLLVVDPANRKALKRLAYTLNASGQRWAAQPSLLDLVQRSDATLDELLLLGHRDISVSLPKPAPPELDIDAVDPWVVLAVCRRAVYEQNWQRAERWLPQLLLRHPDLIEAHVQWGIVLQSTAPIEAWRTWESQLPKEAEQHPGIWVLRGNLARQEQRYKLAAACYGRALKLDPNHRQANYQFGQALVKLERSTDAAPFLEHAQTAQRLEKVLFEIYHSAQRPGDPQKLQTAAQLSEAIGRYWEAKAWAEWTLQAGGDAAWADPFLNTIIPKLQQLPPRTVRSNTPIAKIDLKQFPEPTALSRSPEDFERAPATPPPVPFSEDEDIHFTEVTSTAGISFIYYNGGNAAVETRKMYEFTGGGVAVLDYDNDGWPDIYFTQGCAWPPVEGQREHLDRLYRNRGDGTFEDVTERAGIVEDRFSQGVAAGDYNNDGWVDLYVANIGRNRLLKNNGDGTFTDVADSVAVTGEAWSTSCAIADINGDGWPDIYCANYLSGDDLFERECKFAGGYLGLCPPQRFPAAQDRLYLGIGDGKFRDATKSAGVKQEDGKGLGLVVADLTGNGRLDLYVANDAVPNFLFVNEQPTDQVPFALKENAFAAGAALNDDGLSEAGMGIAAGDADGDGRVDLFVTNYYQESNTLYLNMDSGFFSDATRRSGLHVPSLPFLGFGTQFLDADLDGDLDIVIANGHVDNPPNDPKPYHMRPQLFVNQGRGQFREAHPRKLGDYFEQLHLGRSLAKLDFDGDGKEDLVISHLDAPAALLQNRTETLGNSLAVRLVATESSRDAIGAIVTLTAGAESWTQQLTAGDGYQASNQRQLLFGIDEHKKVDRLRIRWPSGAEQTIENLPATQTLKITEGEPLPKAVKLRSE